jgi:hypothetical protein
MKNICISFVLVGLLVGCSQEPPRNFVCQDKGNQFEPRSLSLSGDKAVFGSVTYQKFCTKAGNAEIYGLEAVDCENRKTPTTKEVRVLSIDPISGALWQGVSDTPNNFNSGTVFQCERVKQ